MSVQLASDIWKLVRESIPYDEREQLADSLVGILVDHGFDLDDVKYEFDDDHEVSDAIKYYAEDTEDEESDDYHPYDEDEDY